jgi:hypothetical protein
MGLRDSEFKKKKSHKNEHVMKKTRGKNKFFFFMNKTVIFYGCSSKPILLEERGVVVVPLFLFFVSNPAPVSHNANTNFVLNNLFQELDILRGRKIQ